MISFVKMQGIGNDFIVLDAIRNPELPGDLAEFARQTCDRRLGVGGDGVLILDRDGSGSLRMRMLNPDGSASEMCGNGLRCVAVLAHANGYVGDETTFPIETGAGTLAIEILDADNVRVNMGTYSLSPADIGLVWSGDRFVNELISKSMRGTAVSMGNPHLVIFTPDVAAIELDHVGPILENHPWFTHRTNVHFVQVESRSQLIQRTWERGAGITLACGTGACACAVAAKVNNLSDRSVDIDLPGGRLHVDVDEFQTVRMTGPAKVVYEGAWG